MKSKDETKQKIRSIIEIKKQIETYKYEYDTDIGLQGYYSDRIKILQDELSVLEASIRVCETCRHSSETVTWCNLHERETDYDAECEEFEAKIKLEVA